MATYEIEFGALGGVRPVPPLTVRTTDPNVLNEAVVDHARPYITPALTELGRPELADCLFRTNRQRSMGQFLHLNFATGMAAEFLPARITTTPNASSASAPRVGHRTAPGTSAAAPATATPTASSGGPTPEAGTSSTTTAVASEPSPRPRRTASPSTPTAPTSMLTPSS